MTTRTFRLMLAVMLAWGAITLWVLYSRLPPAEQNIEHALLGAISPDGDQ